YKSARTTIHQLNTYTSVINCQSIPCNRKRREPIHLKLGLDLGVGGQGGGVLLQREGGGAGLDRHGAVGLVGHVGHGLNGFDLAGLVLGQVLHRQGGGVGLGGEQIRGQAEADRHRLQRLDLGAGGVHKRDIQRNKAV